MTRLEKRLHLCLIVFVCLGVAPALADEISGAPAAEIGTVPAESLLAPSSPAADATEGFESAEADWEGRRGWRYGTSQLFGLSRGMQDAGVPRLARPFLYVLTVPVDTALLPVAAISGLFGD